MEEVGAQTLTSILAPNHADQCGSSLLNSHMWPGILRDDFSEKKLSRIDYAAEHEEPQAVKFLSRNLIS